MITSVAATQGLALAFGGTVSSPAWRVLNSSGAVIASGAGNYSAPGLLAAGSYTLIVGQNTAIGTAGTYTLTLTTASPQTFDLGTLSSTAVSVSNGSPATGAGNLESSASEDDYTFTLAAAGSIAFDLTSCPGLGITWFLYDGSTPVSWAVSSCNDGILTGLAAGDYTMKFTAAHYFTGGTYAFTLQTD